MEVGEENCHYWNEVFWAGKCVKEGLFWVEERGLVFTVEEVDTGGLVRLRGLECGQLRYKDLVGYSPIMCTLRVLN